MAILAIETSLSPGSISLGIPGEILRTICPKPGMEYATWIPSAIEQLLELIRQRQLQLEAVAVTTGPGSYTGLRMGLSTAKGLCMALGTALVGVPGPELTASLVEVEDCSLLVITPFNAREVYTAWFEAGEDGCWKRSAETRLELFSELAGRIATPVVVAGPLRDSHAKELLDIYPDLRLQILNPDAEALCRLAWERLNRAETLDPRVAVPDYISDPTPVRRLKECGK
jgi:tRNA threonylcarbamoyladenosine biosynthesis protein TsaB